MQILSFENIPEIREGFQETTKERIILKLKFFNMKREKNVDTIDEKLVKDFESLHTELVASKDETSELHINLNSAKGEDEEAMKIVQILHSNPKVIPITHSKGKLDRAGTIIAAAGMPGRRTADKLSYFTLNEGEPYGKDTLPEDLDSIDYAVFDVIQELTGKPKLILEKIKSGGSFLAVVAKKCNIIDEVKGFVNLFPKKPGTTNGDKNSSNDTKPETKTESETDKVKDSDAEVKPSTRNGKSSGRISKSPDADTSAPEKGRKK